MKPFACRNCRRVLHWLPDVGWLHGELPQYAHEQITCERPEPVCMHAACDHTANGPDTTCRCRCHQLAPTPTGDPA